LLQQRRRIYRNKAVLTGDPAEVTIDTSVLRAVETLTGEEIANAFIRSVAFAGVSYLKDVEVFCVTTHDDRIKRMVCHMFRMPPGQALKCCQV
jgi:hypothetical protein